METVQSGVLVLYSSLLTAGASNKFGSANANFTDMTFTNINIKQIIGTNYDKYLKFNLMLNSIIIPTTTVAIPISNDANVMIYMSGLPFDQGSTYSTISGFGSNISYVGCVHMVNNTNTNSAIATYPPTFFNTIIKPQDVNDITISLRSAVATISGDNVSFALTSTTIYPQMAFTFLIVPVLETAIMPYPSPEDKFIGFKQRLFKS